MRTDRGFYYIILIVFRALFACLNILVRIIIIEIKILGRIDVKSKLHFSMRGAGMKRGLLIRQFFMIHVRIKILIILCIEISVLKQLIN